jgi:hypothetical protein
VAGLVNLISVIYLLLLLVAHKAFDWLVASSRYARREVYVRNASPRMFNHLMDYV